MDQQVSNNEYPKFNPKQIDIEIDELHKKAMELKKQDELDKAIEILRIVNMKMDESNINYGIGKYLTLSQFLLTANRNDEAWKELNQLKLKTYDKQKNPFNLYIDDSFIEDQMRKHLQKENKNIEAIIHGFFLTYIY